jgi:hypothetical protein
MPNLMAVSRAKTQPRARAEINQVNTTERMQETTMATETTVWGGGLWAAADLVSPMAVRVAATLRLADHIAAGTGTSEALACVVDADQDSLERLLDHLVTAGVLSRTGTDGYSLTALGEHLRDDHPDKMRPWLDLEGAVGRADLSFVHLLHTVRTGEAAFPQQFGREFWDDLSADDERAASFDSLMGARLVAEAPVVASVYPWGEFKDVVDVGGGDAGLLIAILLAHADLRGTVIDLAGPIKRAEQAIANANVGDRANAEVGSFFDPLPSEAGAYVLSSILHNWDDQAAARILRRCADAAGEAGKVLVIDHFVDEGYELQTEGDLRMLCYFRGRQHTIDQLGKLAGSVGLEVTSITPAGSREIVELRSSH